MRCLTAERIHLYLEGALPPEEAAALERHLASCPGCRAAIEDRGRIDEAAFTLEDLEVPADFTARVMERIAPARLLSPRHLLRWVAAAAVGWGAISLALAVGALTTGAGLTPLFVGLNKGFWNYLGGAAYLLGRAAKLAVVAIKVSTQVVRALFEGVKLLTSLAGPELLIGLAVAAAAVIAGVVVLGRKIALEKNHEESA